MKRILFFLFCCISYLLHTEAQQTPWQWVNPLPQGNLINGMWAYNQDTVIAVAELGSIIRTTNGGTTWQVQQTAGGTSDQLFAVQYVSSSEVYAIGESGRALKSTDAGSTWYALSVP